MTDRTTLREAAKGLTLDDRLALIDEMICDVASHPDFSALDYATAAFLDERLRHALDHPDEDRDWEEARDEALANRRAPAEDGG